MAATDTRRMSAARCCGRRRTVSAPMTGASRITSDNGTAMLPPPTQRCGQQPDDSDEEGEDVGLDPAGLAQADQLAAAAGEPGGAVDEETDDDVALHQCAEPGDDSLLDRGDVPVVDLVNVVALLQKGIWER